MARHVSNINFRQRLVQLIVLVVIIIAGMLFSEVALAERPRHKKLHWNAVHTNSKKTCYLLHKKRTSIPKHPLFSTAKRAINKPMAETDPSPRLASSN